MNSNSPLIQAKVTKVDSSLSDLKKEISKCAVYLERLKQDSEKIVGKLNGISTPALYLHEFVGVNSFLLKYNSLLTEINCKFEVMEILESGNGISKSNKNYLNNVYQVFEQPIKAELNSSLDDSLEFLENVEGCNSNLNNNDKERLETNVLEAGKAPLDKKSTDGLEKTLNSNFSDVVKSEARERGSNGISNQVGMSPKEDLCESARKKSNFGFGDSSNHAGRVIDEIKQVKTPSRGFEKTEPVVHEASSDFGVQVDRIKKIQTAGVRDGEKITEHVEGVSPINEIRPLKIPQSLGKEFYVSVKHIVSPSEFYVHFADRNLNLLPELEKQVNSITKEEWKVTKEVKSSKALLCEKIGSYALYFSEVDKMWRRVKVTDWHLDLKDDLVSIFFLDYGGSKLVPFGDLQPMLQNLMKYPAYAQRCHLSGLRPLNGSDNKAFIWDAKAKKEMISALEKAERIKILIAPIDNDHHHPPTSLPVLLWTSNGLSECVNKLLVEKKCAKALNASDGKKVCDDLKLSQIIDDDDDDLLEDEEELLENWNPMKEDYESYLNSYELDINHPAAAIYGYVGKDAKRICPKYARTGKCFKGNTCRKEHTLLNPSGYTTDKEEVYKSAFNPLPPPAVNSIIRVLVTSIVNVNQFYCIAHYQMENSKESLFTLVDYINEKANVREMQKLLVPPSIGQIVLAKYSQDDCWYRAKVLESEPENDLFSLIFVDYGNKETVPLSRIRAIEPRYLHLPFQGMQCFIYGVGKNPEASLEEVMKYISEKMLDQDLKIEVISRFPGDDVSLLVKVFDENGTDIGKDLIAHKYGMEKEDIILSNNCDKIPG